MSVFTNIPTDPLDESTTDESIAETSRAFGIPLPLVKASVAPFVYAVGLRGGDVIEFEHCDFDPEHVWVTLRGIASHTIRRTNTEFPHEGVGITPLMCFDRGLVVRIVDVLWAADAPRGS